MATILGLKELQRKLALMPKVAKIRIRQAMEAGADEIVALAKNLVPVHHGELKKSIAWTWGKAPKGSMTLATVSAIESDLTLTIYAGDDKAFYARWVEFGTAAHNVAKGGGTVGGKKQLERGGGVSHSGSAAHPYFYVSYRALKKRVKSRITRAINKAAKEVAAGG
jgi:HK97 gp10 family phage protein